jgi:hypothetical protein
MAGAPKNRNRLLFEAEFSVWSLKPSKFEADFEAKIGREPSMKSVA